MTDYLTCWIITLLSDSFHRTFIILWRLTVPTFHHFGLLPVKKCRTQFFHNSRRAELYGWNDICLYLSDIDECKTLKARCGNRCRNTVGSYYCDKCPRGFTEGRDGVCIGQLRPYELPEYHFTIHAIWKKISHYFSVSLVVHFHTWN